MTMNPINQLPGVGVAKTASERRVLFTDQGAIYLPHSAVLDGSESRDPGNTGDLDKLRAGMAMGRITASGLWAPAWAGVTTVDYSSGGTSLTVSAATATELARLDSVGSSGTNELVCIGAPTESGTVAITQFTHSAINTSTGVITVTSLGLDKHAGSIVAVNDGRYTPLGLLRDGFPVKTTDLDNDSVDVMAPGFIVGGFVDFGQILPAIDASDTSLVAWVKQQLRLAGPYAFSNDFE